MTSPSVISPPGTSPALPPPAVWELVARQVAEQGRTQGTWGLVTRVVGLLVGTVLAFRLVFDEVLPRLLLVITLAGAALVVSAMVLRAIAEARRQRVLLIALAQLSRLARTEPALRASMAPQIEGIVTALRAEPRVWPWAEGNGHSLASLLARYVPPGHTLPVGASAPGSVARASVVTAIGSALPPTTLSNAFPDALPDAVPNAPPDALRDARAAE